MPGSTNRSQSGHSVSSFSSAPSKESVVSRYVAVNGCMHGYSENAHGSCSPKGEACISKYQLWHCEKLILCKASAPWRVERSPVSVITHIIPYHYTMLYHIIP